MNQLIVEMFNYRDAWTEISSEDRQRFVEGVMQGIGKMSPADVEIIGYAHNLPSTDRRAPYDFFCVYRVADQQARSRLFDQIEQSGWFDYFDQVNLGGPALTPLGLLLDNAGLVTPDEQSAPISAIMPYDKTLRDVRGCRMAYVDVSQGDSIVFLHGDVTSSYLWRNIMPYVESLGRCVAIDLVGAGDSDKLPNSGPGSYSFAEHASYLEPLLDQLDLGNRIVFVGHDWGCNLAFEWAMKHSDRIAGLAFSEPLQPPFAWSDWPGYVKPMFEFIRSEAGERAILDNNFFVVESARRGNIRMLSSQEQAEWERPYRDQGEARRPTITWPREVPFENDQIDMRARIEAHAAWLQETSIPKLYIRGTPGAMIFGQREEGVRRFPALSEISAKGLHWPPEDDPHACGKGLAEWIARVRA